MKNITILLLLLLLLLCFCGYKNINKECNPNSNICLDTINNIDYVHCDTIFTIVKRVIDGDTFETIEGFKVRLIGIDAPESWESKKLDKDSERSGHDKKLIQKLGKLSTRYADSLLFNSKIKLVTDPESDYVDKYGRLLRYCYILNNNIFFNLQIIKDGFAHAYIKYPFSLMEEFLQAQKEARENKRGLWGDDIFFDLED